MSYRETDTDPPADPVWRQDFPVTAAGEDEVTRREFVRYLVLALRPAGTEGFGEEQLAALVTRDSMIGTGLPLPPPR